MDDVQFQCRKPFERWSLVYVIFSVSISIIPILAFYSFSLIWWLLTFLAVIAFLTFSVVLLTWAIARRRLRLVATVLGGIGLVVSDYWVLPIARRTIDDLAFWRHRAVYDEMVARERSQKPGRQPVRMVVEFEDQSVWFEDASFKFIIYDETDRAEVEPDSVQGFWPYPGSNTGVTSVDGSKVSQADRGKLLSRFCNPVTAPS